MVREDGWSAMFSTAFKRSRNAMVLLDDRRRQVEVNGAYLRLLGYSRKAVIGQPIYHFVVGGPVVTPERWAELLALSDFTGEVSMICADGSHVAIQWGAHTELVTGRRLVLFVALSTSRWGQRFRRSASTGADPGQLSGREREIVRLVAEGRTGPEIADELQIAHDTVRTHVRNAMTKAGARSRAHLVAKALGEGQVFR
jgi:PAS domain S-box-containing protein